MRLRIFHTTSYHYDEPPAYALQQLRLTPKSRANQTVLDWQIAVDGDKVELSFDDQHMNHVDLISFSTDTPDITVQCQGEVEVAETHGVVGEQKGFMPLWMFLRATPLTEPGPTVRALVCGLDETSGRLDLLHRLMHAIEAEVRYETGHTNVASSAEEVLEHGHGVCQDHAHVFLAGARALAIPARYVSGYLMMNDRVEQDATHAWAEAYVDDLGWVGFDVSNGISPDMRYVRVATGLDYSEAAPISGVHLGAHGERLNVSVQVQQQ